jgi:hypothetical protein
VAPPLVVYSARLLLPKKHPIASIRSLAESARHMIAITRSKKSMAAMLSVPAWQIRVMLARNEDPPEALHFTN